MTTKIYYLENLGCANCAAKMEARINALPQVSEAVITFATGQLRITGEDPDALLPQVQQIVTDIEAQVRVVTERRREHRCHGEDTCRCHNEHHGHHEHHEHNGHNGRTHRIIYPVE